MARYKNIESLDCIDLSDQSDEFLEGVRFALEEIDKLPTADVEEVKHGEWKLAKIEFGWNCVEYLSEYTCSLCGRTVKQEEPYCHCGAKMDGGKAE